MVEAFYEAHAVDEVDVINFSGGIDHSHDGNKGCQAYKQPCALRKAAEHAVDDGATVIAAAGNASADDHMCCPALLDEAICVGGFVPRCTAELENRSDSHNEKLGTNPSLAGWIDPPSDDRDRDYSEETLCTSYNCSPSPEYSCKDCREDIEWDYNVPSYNSKPDTLAPAVIPVEGDVAYMAHGTSWATPFVTAAVAELIAGAKSQGETVPPEIIRDAIRRSNRPLDKGPVKLFDATGTVEFVFRDQNLRFSPIWHKQQTDQIDD